MADKLAVIQSEETVKELGLIDDRIKGLVSSFNGLVDISAKVSAGLLKGTPKEYLNAEKEMVAIQKQKAIVLKELAEAEKKLAAASISSEKARQAAANALVYEAKARQTVANAEKAEIDVKKKQIQLSQQEEKQLARTLTAYKKFSAEVLASKNKAKDLGAEMIFLEQKFKKGELTKRQYNAQLNKLSKEFVDAKVKASGLDAQIKKLDKSVGDNQRNVGNYKSALSGLNGSFKNLLAAFGVVGAIDIFSGLVKSSYETIKVLDAQNASLKQIFETEAQVAFQKEYLADVTNRYGLEIVSATEGYTKYAAALRGTNLEGEKGRQIFSSFSGASAKLGLNAEQQTGIFKALEQMISKGTVQAEELRGQLGDRMPGAFKLFADAAGVSTKELGEMLKKGEVLASDILPKVAEKLNETYNLGLTTKVDTLAAAQNRLKNSWTTFLDQTAGNKELINGLAFGMEALGDVLNFVLDTLIVKGTDGVSVLGDVIDIMKSLLNAVGDITESLGMMDAKTKNNLFSINAFKNDLKSIQSVISVVTGLIKSLSEQISSFFGTFFQTDGWDKFMNSVDEADAKYKKVYENYLKVQKGVKDANAKGTVYNNEADPYIAAWQKATKEKQAFFQMNGKYFETKSGRNTGKSLDDYIDRNGKLVAKDKTPQDFGNDPEKKKKLKTYKGARLNGEQRDFLMGLQAARDLALAINEKAFTDSEIKEKEYNNNLLKINLDYLDKKIAYLKGKNAKETLEEAKAQLERAKLVKEIQKKNFDIDFKANEEIHKSKMEQLEKDNSDLINNDYLSNSDRLTKQIEIDNKMIDESSVYWENQIALAVAANQEILSLERKRDEEINKLQENRLKNVSSGFENFKKDVEAQTEYLQTLKGITFEEQKQKVLSDKKLSNAQKEYLIDVLSKENQIEENNLEILKLKAIQGQLAAKASLMQLGGASLTPDEIRQIAALDELVKKLENENIKIKIDLKEGLSPQLEALKNIFTDGFRSLGLDNFADQFDDLFDKIKAKTADWKDYTAAAFALIGDIGSQYVESRKEQELNALDEQLRRTQEVTEQEIGFIDGRLERLNALDSLNKEQTEERNALEDEARVLKEQQFQREKQIAAQKAKAEQRAAANQALINGFLAATKTLANLGIPAGIIPAAIAAGFGAIQAGLIMSKNPVPQYFVGRKGGEAEWAVTQDRYGAEAISDKHGNIKTWGSDKGGQLTWLNKGDNVHTAKETKKMLSEIDNMPKLGSNIFNRIAGQNVMPILMHKETLDYDKLAGKVGTEFRRGLKHFDKPTVTTDANGNKYLHEGGKIPVFLGREKKAKTVIKIVKNERN